MRCFLPISLRNEVPMCLTASTWRVFLLWVQYLCLRVYFFHHLWYLGKFSSVYVTCIFWKENDCPFKWYMLIVPVYFWVEWLAFQLPVFLRVKKQSRILKYPCLCLWFSWILSIPSVRSNYTYHTFKYHITKVSKIEQDFDYIYFPLRVRTVSLGKITMRIL